MTAAVMPDKMRQSSVPVFGSSGTGNCGKPACSHVIRALTERARFDIAQHLRRAGCLRREHRRRRQMESQNVAQATDGSAEPRPALAAICGRDTGSAGASGRDLPK